MREGRWRELSVQSHERDDGAAVQHAGLHGGRGGGWPWLGFGPAPERAPLVDPRGRARRFGTAAAAKVAVDRAWRPAEGRAGS